MSLSPINSSEIRVNPPSIFRPKRNIPPPPGPPSYPPPETHEKVLKKRTFEAIEETQATTAVNEIFSTSIHLAALENFMQTAEAYYQANDNRAASYFIDKAAEINPNAYDVLIIKAKLHRRNNELDEAEKLLLKAIENDPLNYIGYTSYAYLQLDLGHERIAIRMGMQSLAIHPDQPVLLETLGALPNLQKETSSSKKQVRFDTSANQTRPIPHRYDHSKLEIEEVKSEIAIAKNIHSMIQLGMLYYRCEEYQNAIATLEEILIEAVEPSEEGGHRDDSVPVLLGKCYFRLEQYPQTEQYWRFALDITKKPKKIYKKLVALYTKTNDAEAADFYTALL